MLESEGGTTSRELLNRLRISMFSRLAMAAGISVILLWAKVNRVTLCIVHSRGICWDERFLFVENGDKTNYYITTSGQPKHIFYRNAKMRLFKKPNIRPKHLILAETDLFAKTSHLQPNCITGQKLSAERGYFWLKKATSAEIQGWGIYWVKGSVPVLFWNLHHRGEMGEMGGSANFREQSPQNLWPNKYLNPCKCFPRNTESDILNQNCLGRIVGRNRAEMTFVCSLITTIQLPTSSRCRRFFSLKSISARGRLCASSSVFLIILDADMVVAGEFPFCGE